MKFLIFTLLLISIPLQAEVCSYGLNEGSVKLRWTGFKTTKKTAVSGTFKKIDWSFESASDLNALMKNIKFKIKTNSIDSGNFIRDRRLYGSFLKLMNEGNYIQGHGISIDEKNKTAVIEVEMNKQRTPVIFSFENTKDKTFTMKGALDVLKHYKMKKSFDSLAKLCEKLHTGEDGVAKTWSDVDLTITGRITKKCSK